MSEGRQREEWRRLAVLRCDLATYAAHGKVEFEPDQFNPFEIETRESKSRRMTPTEIGRMLGKAAK
ncbi:MAG: hypothetical protein AAGI17_01905 [Planctomycetota bacterium]